MDRRRKNFFFAHHVHMTMAKTSFIHKIEIFEDLGHKSNLLTDV